MSRWSRKTEAEKQLTKDAIDDNERKNKSKTQVVLENREAKKFQILKDGELPLLCNRCGPTTSKRYNLVMMRTPLGDQQAATGKCVTCGKWCKVYLIPSVLGLEGSMLVAMILTGLSNDGRLNDKRKAKAIEWR